MKESKKANFNCCNVFDLPSLEKIKEYAQTAFLYCPAKVQKDLQNTSIAVENCVPSHILIELKLSGKNELLGIYKISSNSLKCELILFRNSLIMYSIASHEKVKDTVIRVTVSEVLHKSKCIHLRQQWLNKIKNKSVLF
ncbi:MAG: hypothetical protein LBS83_02455 [Holosporales bacterium]|jgi:predicted Zn-dependent protease with MMP-like domain|nr:hypothetical protein [Holosporales bacterium]